MSDAVELWECSGLTELWNAARPLSVDSARSPFRVTLRAEGRDTIESFHPEPTAKGERAEAPVSGRTVGTQILALAPNTFADGSGLNDSV